MIIILLFIYPPSPCTLHLQLGAAIAEDTPLFLTGGCIVLWYLYHFATDLIKVVLDQCNIDIDDIECACMINLKSLLGMKRKVG